MLLHRVRVQYLRVALHSDPRTLLPDRERRQKDGNQAILSPGHGRLDAANIEARKRGMLKSRQSSFQRRPMLAPIRPCYRHFKEPAFISAKRTTGRGGPPLR